MFVIYAIPILFILLFVMEKIRNQHKRIMEQNEEIKGLLREIRDK